MCQGQTEIIIKPAEAHNCLLTSSLISNAFGNEVPIRAKNNNEVREVNIKNKHRISILHMQAGCKREILDSLFVIGWRRKFSTSSLNDVRCALVSIIVAVCSRNSSSSQLDLDLTLWRWNRLIWLRQRSAFYWLSPSLFACHLKTHQQQYSSTGSAVLVT